jgi:hypothetical protein
MIYRLRTCESPRDIAFAAVAKLDGSDAHRGVSRYGGSADGSECEIAVTVRDDWQHAGVGTCCSRTCCRSRRPRHQARVVDRSGGQHAAMDELARYFGFERPPGSARRDPGDPQSLAGLSRTRTLARPRAAGSAGLRGPSRIFGTRIPGEIDRETHHPTRSSRYRRLASRCFVACAAMRDRRHRHTPRPLCQPTGHDARATSRRPRQAATATVPLPRLRSPAPARPGRQAAGPSVLGTEPLKPGEFAWEPQFSTAGPLLVVVQHQEQTAYVYRNGLRIGRSSVSTGKKATKRRPACSPSCRRTPSTTPTSTTTRRCPSCSA